VILAITLASLAALSLVLTIWQVAVAARFPLHRRRLEVGFQPGITILKPLKGCDDATAACLGSWLTPEYQGPIQVLFGVTSLEDPVCLIVQRLIAEHPDCQARLVICPERLGSNEKVSTLVQLERLAQHEILCVSDADVWAPPDFLANAVAPLRDSHVGLVNGFYRLVEPSNLPMRWEAFAINADFWSQVLQSLSLKPMDFALGAAMVLSRPWLVKAGGFGNLVDQLADDYQLGHRIAGKGGRVELCPVVLECRSAPMELKEVWAHQLRWARTIRVCEPAPFFFSVLSNATVWPLLWAAVVPSRFSLLGTGLCLATRMAAGAWLERRLLGKWQFSSWPMALAKDILHLGVWLLAFIGREVKWRGERYEIGTGGTLLRSPSVIPAPVGSSRAELRRTLE
jgi:ceramide glucosyltransferase